MQLPSLLHNPRKSGRGAPIGVSRTNVPARAVRVVAGAFRPGVGHPCAANPVGLSFHNAWAKKSPHNGGLLGGVGGLFYRTFSNVAERAGPLPESDMNPPALGARAIKARE